MQTITATRELNRCFTFAAKVGCHPDQMTRFVEAGYIPQAKQLEFHAAARECDNDDGPNRVGYGGTRGQAKSHAVIAQIGFDDCQRFPGLKCLYLRNIGKAATEQFEDLVNKLFQHIPHDFKPTRGSLKFPNGSRIILGGFRDEKDIDAYLGIEYDLIVLEDATLLTKSKYDAICGSLRSSKAGWRPRLYSTANPGGVGHAWFKKLFVDSWLLNQQEDTRFIHTTMNDNVFIDQTYNDYLNGLTGWLRRAWRDGDFSISAGQFFTTFNLDTHVIDPIDLQPNWTYWAALDYGFSHWNVVQLFAQDGDGSRYVIDEHAQRRWLVYQHQEAIKAMLARHDLSLDRLNIFVAGPDVFIKRGTTHKDGETKSIAEEYEDYGIKLLPAQTDRINGAAKLLSYLGDIDQAIPPKLFIFNRCARLINCLPEMQHDPKRPEDVLKVDCDLETGTGGDDDYDTCRYGLMVDFSSPPAGTTIQTIPMETYKPQRRRR